MQAGDLRKPSHKARIWARSWLRRSGLGRRGSAEDWERWLALALEDYASGAQAGPAVETAKHTKKVTLGRLIALGEAALYRTRHSDGLGWKERKLLAGASDWLAEQLEAKIGQLETKERRQAAHTAAQLQRPDSYCGCSAPSCDKCHGGG